MSEHIASKVKIHKLNKPKQPQSHIMANDNLSDDVSKDVHESTAQRRLPPEARVSARVELQETSRSI